MCPTGWSRTPSRTPIRTARTLIGAALSALAVIAVSCGGGSSSSPSSPSPSFASDLLAGSTQVPALADLLAEKRLGSADAPNLVIQYSSLGCSHCADFHTQSLPTLKRQYLDTGIASFIYRDFPLDRPSLLGAMVARCAGDGRYFAVLDVIYQSQLTWAYSADPWSALQTVLRSAGLAQSLIDACVTTAGLEQGVNEMRDQGIAAYGISGTPTFIVNGTRVVGNVPLATLTSYFK